MFLLTLPPAGAAPIHKHPSIGIGYVLDGVYESQYEGEPLKRFAAGEAIYDLQDTPHFIARNATSSEPLRVVMTFVVRKGQPTILPLLIDQHQSRIIPYNATFGEFNNHMPLPKIVPLHFEACAHLTQGREIG